MNGNFVWRDAGRTVVFDAGGVAAAPKLLAEHGMEQFELLTTARHLDAGDGLAEAAAAVHELPPADPATAVPESAAALLDSAAGPNLVALGGGRDHRHRQGDRRGDGRRRRGDPDDDVGGRDDRHPPPARRR